MAIAAQRFKYLDKETNLPTIDLTEMSDNQVYNNASETVQTALAEMQDAEATLTQMNDSLSDLGQALASATEETLATLKSALDSAIDAIANLELPDIVKNLFAKLKALDLKGVKDFFKDLLKVGANFLCHNLDFLKMFMLGYALNGNVLGGLIIALLMSWLDKFCKGFTKEETQKANTLGKLEMVSAPTGMPVDASNAFSRFTHAYADYTRASAPITPTAALSSGDFLSNVLSGNITQSLANLRSSEISSVQKSVYLKDLTDAIGLESPGSTKYNHLLSARGQLQNLPLISVERRAQTVKYSSLSDQLGSMAKNLMKVDLGSINKFSLSGMEKSLYNKIEQFKRNATASPDLRSRSLNAGAYRDFDFASVMPALSAEEATYVTSLESENLPHRVHGLHPTTEVFLL